MAKAILTLNAGSSSLKFALFRASSKRGLKLLLRGEVEEIGSKPHFWARDPHGTALADEAWPEVAGDIDQLMLRFVGRVEGNLAADGLMVVGHRIVHGGSLYSRPERVTPDLIETLERLTPLAPLHEPRNVQFVRTIAALRPNLPQIACFDTAFHQTMPVVATRFALPREYEADGVRRYGFHGLSYEYIAEHLARTAPHLARGRVIVAHLGSGASLCAMRDGKSIDTTMGFSALDGLVMGTRPGTLDPGVILFMLQQKGLAVGALEELLYRRSGLLGVSGGISSDMRTLLASSDKRAAEAVALFAYRAGREAGALASSLGGLDGLVFTAGIGEHAPPVRSAVCARLAWLGITLDEDANARNAPIINRPESRIEVRVIPTDEESVIAQHALEMIHL
ncbi:MAG: acetate/propionate family kinase [Rhizobiaceae bacterium]